MRLLNASRGVTMTLSPALGFIVFTPASLQYYIADWHCSFQITCNVLRESSVTKVGFKKSWINT